MEVSRQKKRIPGKDERSKRNLRGEKIDRENRMDEVKRRSDRAKILTNDGELSKAFATMVRL